VRVIRDGVGNITQGDTTLHTNVRFLVDDKHRVAVFTNTKAAPSHVYAEGEVLFTVTRKPCACKGDTAKMTLTRAWMSYDKVDA
jgi:hypothetical protein